MSKQHLSSRHLQQKISKFCEMRVAPVAPETASKKIERYLTSLIAHRKAPPRSNDI